MTLLRNNSALRALIIARSVSSAGTWLAYVALTVDVYSRTHSAVWVSAVLFSDFLPTVCVAVFAGPWLDRISRRTLLIGAEAAAGIVFVALIFAPSAAAVVGLALCVGIASAVYYPSLAATMPMLVDKSELPRANSLSQTAGNSGLAAGPLLAGFLVAASGVHLVYALNAASFAISALLLTRLPALSAARAATAADAPSYWHDAAVGARVFLRSSLLRMVMRAWLLAAFAGAVIGVGEIFLARGVFHAGTVGFGVLASGSGSGIVAGSILSGRIRTETAVRALQLALICVTVGFAAAALSPDVWVAGVCAFVGGLGNGLAGAASTLLVQSSTEDATRGRAFAAFDASRFTAAGLGMAVSGVAIGALGARGAWLAAAGVFAIATLSTISYSALRKVPRAEVNQATGP